MSTDTKAIIGTIVAATISLGGLLSVQFAGVNTPHRRRELPHR